jgi:hypothetical protein
MNPWRKTRSELAGAWRSVRYDLGKRSGAGLAAEEDDPVADVTSTGMSTFGGPLAGEPYTGYTLDQERRPPRRVAAAGAFGVLAVAGAAGSYFAVVNGLGSLLAEKPAGAEPYPLAAAAPPEAEAASTARMGRGNARPAEAPAAATVLVVPTTAATATPAPAVARQVRARTTPAPPQRTATPAAPVPPGCDCMTPPVPTPTAPSATPSPSDSPSASATPTDSEPPYPGDWVEPSEGREGFVHPRHQQG